MSENGDFALVTKPSSAVEKAEPGAKRILSAMVEDTLGVARRERVAAENKKLDREAYCRALRTITADDRAKMPPMISAAPASKAIQDKPKDEAEAIYRRGIEFSKQGEHEQAFDCFKRAAERGHLGAQHQLGWSYYTGHGVRQDYAEAVKWYCKAADQGLAGAQNDLGLVYDIGQGVPQDYTEAARRFRQAAEQGYALAQRNLGEAYHDGHGVPQEYTEAVKWYRKAAEQGNAVGQCNLGAAYHEGHGVPQDYSEAVKWFRNGAEQGFDDAQRNLG